MKLKHHNIETVLTVIAASFAVIVTIIIPSGYFMNSYQFMIGSMDAQADLSSRAVSMIVTTNPTMWQFEQVRLAELLEKRPLQNIPEQRRIVTLNGEVVAESNDSLAEPIITRESHVYDAGSHVAHIRISRSIRPLLFKTLFLCAASIMAGGCLFIILRTVPLRTIRNAYVQVEMSEARYRTLYESLNEGVVLTRVDRDPRGEITGAKVIDINPAAILILDMDPEAVLGNDAVRLFGEEFRGHFSNLRPVLDLKQTCTFEFNQETTARVFRISAFAPDSESIAFLVEDETERKRADDQIKRLAYHDVLTGLPNRLLLQDRLEQSLALAARENEKIAVMFLDLDRFKIINDTLGHSVGDLLLVQASLRFRQSLRGSDTLARIGGDEFVILIPYRGDEVNAAHVAQNLIELASMPYDLGTREVRTTVSIGIAIYPDDGIDSQTLLSSADMAMYAAKESGRNSYNFFSREMNAAAHERLELESSLRMALQRDEFFLEFQPIVECRNGKIVAAETLLRWQHPERGRVMPGVFIAVAEETGLIIPLGEWVLRSVCRKMLHWREMGLPPVRVSVNVSGIQFRQPSFVDFVAATVVETGIDPHFLELELTETSLMENAEASVARLYRLKELEIGIAVDDFGAGYSSLAYLKNFPIDRLKIDRSFIKDVCERPDDKAIVEAIIALAASLKLYIVAEGVEEESQSAFLVAQNCDEIQGFYYHRPMSEEELVGLLKSELSRG